MLCERGGDFDAADGEPRLRLSLDDAVQRHRSGLDDHRHDREHERQLVRNELGGGAEATNE